jgi:magnesium transporter
MRIQKIQQTELPVETSALTSEQILVPVKITVIDYSKDHYEVKAVNSVEECFSYKEKPTVTWINVDGIHAHAIIEQLGVHYGLHPLIIEDICTPHQRLKVDIFDEYVVIILNMLTYNAQTYTIEIEQVSLVLGKNFVITFQEEKPGDVFAAVRDQIKDNKGQIRKTGADYLAYALLDAVINGYFDIIERFDEQIESIDEELISGPQSKILQHIHVLRRELIYFRKSVWPLRSMINELAHQQTALIKKSTVIYLSDLYDHIIQIMDTVEIFKDLITGIRDVYLSSMSNKMNEIMQLLTIIGTIFIPLTFLAGVYGMNFRYMPELTWKWGYPFVWVIMIGIGIGMLGYFKKKKWF